MKLKKFFIFLLIILFFYPINKIYANDESINLYSESAILMDSESGMILFSKDAEKKMYPASTTKILTAIIAIENCKPNDMVTVSSSSISTIPSGYTSSYLVEGEEISVRDLITVFLVHSANDAGYVLAEHISGSIKKFAELMNKKALEIGCKNSNFVNPSGIHDSNHYSTAYDLCLIAKYCMKNEAFRYFVSLENCTIPATNKSNIRKYANTNDLINSSSKYFLNDCIGIKTGYTSEAKNCLISCFKKNELELLCVVLGASYTENGDSARYFDSRTLHDYGFKNYSKKTLFEKNSILKTIEISNATNDSKSLDLYISNDIQMLVPNSVQNLSYDINLNKDILAPINANEILGTITFSINNIKHTENLLASHAVFVKKKNIISYIFILFCIIFFIGFLFFIFLKNIVFKNKMN